MTRCCQNQYRHCTNVAVSNYGNSFRTRLCQECLDRRKQRQQLTASQLDCQCGNKVALGKERCRRCEEWLEARAYSLRANGITEEELAESAHAHREAAALGRGQ